MAADHERRGRWRQPTHPNTTHATVSANVQPGMTWFYEHYRDASAVGIHTTTPVHEEQSTFQHIAVFDTVAHGRMLILDGMVMLTELDEFAYHDLLTHVPLAIHPQPRSVLIVGGGDGGCVREALRHPSVERVVLCEIDERVTRVCQEFLPSVAGSLEDPRVELEFSDAVDYVKRHAAAFDCVLIDSTEPIGPAAALFESKFHAAVDRALTPDGVMAAQAESPYYAAETVRDFFGAARRSYARVEGYAGVVPTYPGGLWTFCLGSRGRGPESIDVERLRAIAPRYFGAENARASFHLPPFVRELVGP
jgi:spermidine synthase